MRRSNPGASLGWRSVFVLFSVLVAVVDAGAQTLASDGLLARLRVELARSSASPVEGQGAGPTEAALAVAVDAAATRASRREEPWSLDAVLKDAGAPDWLRVYGGVQLRFGALGGQFRPGSSLDRSDELVSLRTLLAVEADLGDLTFLVEGQDSRVFGAGSGTALSTADVDAFELLQASVTIDFSGGRDGGMGRLTFGRQTMDLGSRRLVARNRFRNTINAFTGARWDWDDDGRHLTVFATLPVQRLPEDFPALKDNAVAVDDEDLDRKFFGVHFDDGFASVEGMRIELYAYGLWENGRDTAGRRFGTVGLRLHRPRRVGVFDFEIETIVQFGESRIRRRAARSEHLAGFVHAHLAYTFDVAWTPRIRVSLDVASGDDDPNDDENNRFDSLFGAPTEYGPTGLYGFFARQNFITPEIRFEFDPRDDLHVRLYYRPAWAESRRDGVGAALIQDPTGDSGRFIGHQYEVYVRWTIPEARLRVEAGFVYLDQGRFLERAPAANGRDTTYGYVQFVWSF